jgi:uncharacterized membrane protein YedE/YeeE
VRLVGLLFGSAFGFLLALAGLNDYEVIHNMLLLERKRWRTPFAGTLRPARSKIERHHITGSAIFGTGWAIAGTCPAPALAMTGSGALLGLVVVGGMFAGLMARDYAEARAGAEPSDLDTGITRISRLRVEA